MLFAGTLLLEERHDLVKLDMKLHRAARGLQFDRAIKWLDRSKKPKGARVILRSEMESLHMPPLRRGDRQC